MYMKDDDLFMDYNVASANRCGRICIIIGTHQVVVYHLSSIAKKHSLVVKANLPRWKDDVEGQLPEVPTVSDVWRTADWHERELYDLSGVRFVGHPNLRRILCPEDWVGHPLRKDYEMPLEYHGIRGR